jgi:hypothetical protein
VDYRKLNVTTKKVFSTAPDLQHSVHTGWRQMILHTRSEERLLTSRGAPGRQGENSVLDRSRIVALYSYSLRSLQHSGDLREINGDTLRGLTYDSCLVYPDDVIVIGQTFQEHLLNLREVFERL